jgi:hypothetical protein
MKLKLINSDGRNNTRVIVKTANRVTAFAAILLVFGTLIGNAGASVIIQAYEAGGDVTLSYSGTLSGTLTDYSNAGTSPSINPAAGRLWFFPSEKAGSYVDVNYFSSTTLTPAFGTGGGSAATSASGDTFLVGGASFNHRIFVEKSYVPGSMLNGQMTFESSSLNDLGIDLSGGPLTLATLAGSGDTITIEAIPEPATIAFVGLFGGGLWIIRRYFPSV